MLPKTKACVKSYDGQTKWMYFLIENDNLLEKYNTIWDKASADIKKEFDKEPANNEKVLKTKMNSYLIYTYPLILIFKLKKSFQHY